MSSALSINPVSHCFDIEDAKLYGITAAVILKNFKHWIWYNKLNRSRRHYHEGRYWTYYSMPQLQKEVFSYLTLKQIRLAISKLIKKGAVITANFNSKRGDRTFWYSVPHESAECDEESDTICQKQQMGVPKRADEWQSASTTKHVPERAFEYSQKGTPLPYINTDIKKKRKRTVPMEPSLSAKDLLEYWNTKNIIQHTITDTLIASIAKAIRKRAMPLEAIKQAIDRFAEVLGREDCYWTKKWTLSEFLSDRAERFYAEDYSIESFLSSSKSKKIGGGVTIVEDDGPLSDRAVEIFESIYAKGREERLKKGLTHEHIPE